MKNMQKSYENNKRKLSGTSWEKKAELPGESSVIKIILYYFEYSARKYEKNKQTNKQKNIFFNFPSQVYFFKIENKIISKCIFFKIENRIISKIKSGYFLEVLTPETV